MHVPKVIRPTTKRSSTKGLAIKGLETEQLETMRLATRRLATRHSAVDFKYTKDMITFSRKLGKDVKFLMQFLRMNRTAVLNSDYECLKNTIVPVFNIQDNLLTCGLDVIKKEIKKEPIDGYMLTDFMKNHDIFEDLLWVDVKHILPSEGYFSN